MKPPIPLSLACQTILLAVLAVTTGNAIADTIVAPANLVGHWVADDWSGNKADPWVSRIEVTINSSTGEKIYSPATVYTSTTPVKLQGEDGFNARVAKDGIRFSGNSYFRVTDINNPIAPKNAAAARRMTAIVLFRTSSNGLCTGTAWYQNSGIVSADTTGTTSNDWGLAINASGNARAGVGGATAAASGTGASAFVADGKSHTLAFTWGDRPTNEGIGRMYIDGKLVGETAVWGNGVNGPLASSTIAIGSDKTTLRFTGDIAEIRLYNDIVDVAAVHAEMVPEPGTLALLATGTLCAGAFLLRRKRFG